MSEGNKTMCADRPCMDIELERKDKSESITISVPVEISQSTMRKATRAWMAGDDSQTIRDHLLDVVEVSPVFHVKEDSSERIN